MPKRTNIKSILIIGAGPIVIGQGCEFDYSGVQACKALKAEGYRTILINSNPATIMTDPEICDATYIEPIQVECITSILEKEKPDALLPTMGGQTALNCALELARTGILQKYSVELIGANETAIHKAEDREQFRAAMHKIGLTVPKAKIANSLESALNAQREIGFPTIVRPSFTLGGSGGGIAYTQHEFETICKRGLALSPIHQLLIEESLLGWKEFELEVMRDKKDNCIIVCTIENFDPMGIHTGDSITIAPAQTLTDKEYQRMRNAAIAVLREVGVETGGANVQFAIHPKTGCMVIIEMNPRVSRSSALASKATGFPIAKIAAKLAVGYTLDELKNDITQGKMPASFEPTIDYVVTKIPRFNFEKFETADSQLTTQMKSVGEVMAIGRTFQESLQKALCSLETGFDGLTSLTTTDLTTELETAGPYRINFIAEAFRKGFSLEIISKITNIDPWFLVQIEDLIITETNLTKRSVADLTKEEFFLLKRKGFSDRRLATLLKVKENDIRSLRYQFKIHPTFKRVDTCAAEFPTDTAYLYSTYEVFCEAEPSSREKIIILGSGPNRIGQGIEFDYCCVHAVLALKESGYETIMINCNPETVSTDYDISDRLYFEPLTLEHILEIVAVEKPKGVIVQYGGQTPLKLTQALQAAGVPLIGTSSDSIDCAEDRKRFSQLLQSLHLKQPENGIAYTLAEGEEIARTLGFPIVVRPSYVLGGQGMKVVHNFEELNHYLTYAVRLSEKSPVLLDRFLKLAIEVDIDAVSDGNDVLIGGILEHIEYAGIHSGDSACSLPPFRLTETIQKKLLEQTVKITKALQVIGPINIQFAIQGENIFVIEANPRASRTVPFVSKATGLPLAQIGARCMVNQTLQEQGITQNPTPTHFSIKLPVFSFNKFPGIDPKLGPEMKSTGEAMGIGKSLEEAFAKSTLGIWPALKVKGSIYLNVDDEHIIEAIEFSKEWQELGFKFFADAKTSLHLKKAGISIKTIELNEVIQQPIDLVIIITEDPKLTTNTAFLRIYCVENQINYLNTVPSVKALIARTKLPEHYPVYQLQKLFSM